MFQFANKEIIYQKRNGIAYIQFSRLLKYHVKHAYTLKAEGIDFSGNSVLEAESYEKLATALDIDATTIVKPKQTHTSVVKCIDGIQDRELLENVDGLITDKKNVTLSTKNADCILFLFYDPVKKVIANVHSGWKGTFQKIAEKTVVKMINYYQCDPKDIICCICPSIRKCHFEVDEDVKILCEEIFKFTGKIEKFITVGEIKDGKQKYMIDTIRINQLLLTALGIKEKNIIDSNICSVCHSDKIASYRVEGKNYQRATAVICL